MGCLNSRAIQTEEKDVFVRMQNAPRISVGNQSPIVGSTLSYQSQSMLSVGIRSSTVSNKKFIVPNRFSASMIGGDDAALLTLNSPQLKSSKYLHANQSLPVLSIANTSLLSIGSHSTLVRKFVRDHKEGRRSCLNRLLSEYTASTLDTSPSDDSVIWDLQRMTEDYVEWDDNFDGLKNRATNRNDIAMVILKGLIANGASVNLTSHGKTALQVTVLSGDMAFCKELIKMKADVHKKNEAGETALSIAREWNNKPKNLDAIITYLASFKSTS